MKIKISKYCLLCLALSCGFQKANSQSNLDSSQIVQVSGLVIELDENDEILPVPYATISLVNTNRGTVSDYDGFYSITAKIGDTLIFSCLGYENSYHIIPDSVKDDWHTCTQILKQQNHQLPEITIYPWPSRAHYKIEFLALNEKTEMRYKFSNHLKEILSSNLDQRSLNQKDPYALMLKIYNPNVYESQSLGMSIPLDYSKLNFKKFFRRWRKGDFRKKNPQIFLEGP